MFETTTSLLDIGLRPYSNELSQKDEKIVQTLVEPIISELSELLNSAADAIKSKNIQRIAELKTKIENEFAKEGAYIHEESLPHENPITIEHLEKWIVLIDPNTRQMATSHSLREYMHELVALKIFNELIRRNKDKINPNNPEHLEALKQHLKLPDSDIFMTHIVDTILLKLSSSK